MVHHSLDVVYKLLFGQLNEKAHDYNKFWVYTAGTASLYKREIFPARKCPGYALEMPWICPGKAVIPGHIQGIPRAFSRWRCVAKTVYPAHFLRGNSGMMCGVIKVWASERHPVALYTYATVADSVYTGNCRAWLRPRLHTK